MSRKRRNGQETEVTEVQYAHRPRRKEGEGAKTESSEKTSLEERPSERLGPQTGKKKKEGERESEDFPGKGGGSSF